MFLVFRGGVGSERIATANGAANGWGMTSLAPEAQRTRLVSLRDGRRLAAESYGDPQGTPVFFFHGWPSSRWQGAVGDEAAKALGVHFIALDRPGVGESDPQEPRCLLDWPGTLATVADAFGAERFYVFGVSGGGPYAMVSAWAMPERVQGAAVVSGAPPLAGRKDHSHLMPVYRWLLAAYRRHPEAMRRLFRMMRPVATIRPPLPLWKLIMLAIPPCDRLGLNHADILDRAWAGYSGAWVGDVDGVFCDARIYAEPWGFDPAGIRVPLHIWHGTEDRNFDWHLAEEFAASIPGCQTHWIENEGHYSLVIHRHEEILRKLVGRT
jgi:pimeloyl-ACP methyl ester carboxylesterase